MDNIIKLTERVTIVGTGKSSHLPKDKEYQVHPLNAEFLVKSGRAVYKKKSE